MELSEEAKKDLIKMLEREIGSESVSMLNDKDLNEIGFFLLTLRAQTLKMAFGHKRNII